MQNVSTVLAAPGHMAARLHNTMAMENAFRVPRRSVMPPAKSMPMAYAAWKADVM